MPAFTTRKLAVAAALVVLPLSFAACGSNTTTGSAPASSAPMSSAPMSSAPMETPSMSSANAPFGSACADVPTTGKGSFDGMSQDPVATAASNNPALSTLVTAVKTAGLVDTLNNAQDITVFAPANGAFTALGDATVKKVLADKKTLTSILTLHVVPGKLSPDQLAGTHKTLNGQSITVKGSGESFTVGDQDANVVCGNVQTANATVYIIDKVLLPKS